MAKAVLAKAFGSQRGRKWAGLAGSSALVFLFVLRSGRSGGFPIALHLRVNGLRGKQVSANRPVIDLIEPDPG